MAEGEDSCYGDELDESSSPQPDDCSIATRSLLQASRLLEERIRNFDSGDDFYEYCSFGDDMQLYSDDFYMSLLPTDSQKPPLVLTVPSAAAEHSNQSGKPKSRPVPRPRLSKMLPRTVQPANAAAVDLLCAAAVTSDSSRHGASDSGCAGSGEDPLSDTKGVEPLRRTVADPWAAGCDFTFVPDDLDSYAASATQYRVQLEFAQKLGFSEAELRAALAIAGPEADSNRLLSALIQVHDADSTARADGCGGDVSSPAAAFDLPASLQQLQLATALREHTDSSSNSSKRNSTEALVRLHSDDVFHSSASAHAGGEDDEDDLRAIVIDGSNVAMSHGNKQVFSCRGIQIVVNWFRQRGHKTITVFVPQWRKETSYPMAPISDQYVLDELEQEKVLAYTPSRRLHGRRVACYDDRYILQLACSEDAVVVSNDNYRDLAKESPAFKRVVEERLLMYTFVNDRFMPPDDPLGRHGPTLDQFLRRSLAKGNVLSTRGSGSGPRGFGSGQLCPYGRKCTYGVKCKYAHPERSAAAGGASGGSGRTALGSALPVAPRLVGSPAHAVAEGASLAAYSPDQSRTRSPVMRSMSSNYAGAYASSASVVWSLGATAPEDENRTHSLPADCSAPLVTTAGNSSVSTRAAAASRRLLRTDTDVLNECEQRLAAVRNAPTAALPMQPGTAAAAAAAVLRPPGTRWRRSLPQDSTISSESHALAATSGGYGWHGGGGLRHYEDPRVSDVAATRFMATAYELDSAPSSSGASGSGGSSNIVGSNIMQNLLHRQHSYSDPHLSGSFYSSGSDCAQAGHTSSGSPYNSSGELVARTSWPYCTGDQQQQQQHTAAPISTLYPSAQQLLPRGAAQPVHAYQEVIPAAAQSWSYFGDAYSHPPPPPHLLLPGSSSGGGGRHYAAAVLSYGGGQPAGYSFVSGASVGVSSSNSSMGNGHASGTFVDAFAHQPTRVLLSRNAGASVPSMPVEDEDAHALTGSSAGACSSTGFRQY